MDERDWMTYTGWVCLKMGHRLIDRHHEVGYRTIVV